MRVRTAAQRGAWRQTKYAKFHQWLNDFRDYLLCSQCGTTKHLVFHHLRDKKYNISHMHEFTTESVLREMQKCDVLCRSCHCELHEPTRWEPK